jgi:hypothetical protein
VDDAPLPGTAGGAIADSAKNNRPPSPRPPLEAVAKDEERREKAREHLVRALQSYINKLGQAKDRNAHRETEIFCDYARENYASRAEPYFEAMPPMDPKALFEVGDLTEQRDLSGLPTIGDVLERVKDVKVRRPNHWPDPAGIYRGDESPKLRRALHELIIGEHESFEWLLEEPWDHWFRQQIHDCIKGCVRDKRKEYESRLTPEESNSAENHDEMDGTRTAKVYKTILGRNIDRLRRGCGWSFDVLADKTGLDKKLILGHVNEGRPAQARTLKTYADAFARELKRPVTVAELEA